MATHAYHAELTVRVDRHPPESEVSARLHAMSRDWKFCPYSGALLEMEPAKGKATCTTSGCSRNLSGVLEYLCFSGRLKSLTCSPHLLAWCRTGERQECNSYRHGGGSQRKSTFMNATILHVFTGHCRNLEQAM